MSLARHLITHAVQGGRLPDALDAGVTTDWLTDPADRDVWQFLCEFQTRYGKAAGPQALAAEYPTYKLADTPEPLDFVLDRLRDQRKTALLEMALLRASHAFAAADNATVERELAAVLRDIEAQIPATSDVDLSITGPARVTRYRERAARDGGLVGIPTGFDAMDAATGGFRDGQLISLLGPPKAGKSTFMQWSSLAAWRAPRRPMYVTFEMPRPELEERLDALEAGVSSTELRDGTLSPLELDKVERTTRRMELRPQYWLTEDSASTMTVSGLVAKATRLRAQILFVDGVYMMQDELGGKPGEWLALGHIMSSLKQAAKALQIPIVVSTQVRESKMHGGKITSASIGYSPAFAEYSDVLLAVQPTRDHNIVKMVNLPGRSVAPFEFWMERDWASGRMYEHATDPLGEVDDDDQDDDRF